MKKILIAILCVLSYQQATLTTTNIKLSTLTNPDGTSVVATCLLDNGWSTGKIKDITEEQLAKVITATTKIPLYAENALPYGYGPENGKLALVMGGRPVSDCYILGKNVYDSTGKVLGEYYKTLVTSDAAKDAGASSLGAYLRITENGGAGNGLVATFIGSSVLSPEASLSLTGVLRDATADYGYEAYCQASVPDDYFLQVYIKPVAASAAA